MEERRWEMAGPAVFSRGKYRIGDDPEWTSIDSIPGFYKQVLTETPIRIERHEKFFRIGEQSAVTIAMALLLLRRIDPAGETDFGSTAILGYGDEGSHAGNLTYWRDYVDNGKVAAQGHLFVGTLAATPLCQLALVLGCHAPVFYVSTSSGSASLASEIDFLGERCGSMFLIDSEAGFCRCHFLRPARSGLAPQEIALSMGDVG